jgi:hypothetical protein
MLIGNRRIVAQPASKHEGIPLFLHDQFTMVRSGIAGDELASPAVAIGAHVQNVPKWELFVNRLHRAGRNLLLTGSNAHLLSSELATHLTGRHVQIPLLPLSFSECLAAEGGGAAQTDLERREACRRYARRGGFPEVVLNALSGPEYLRTLVASVVYKDIVSRFRPRAPGSIETIARCASSPSPAGNTHSTPSRRPPAAGTSSCSPRTRRARPWKPGKAPSIPSARCRYGSG